jgi:hypothetical protein
MAAIWMPCKCLIRTVFHHCLTVILFLQHTQIRRAWGRSI